MNELKLFNYDGVHGIRVVPGDEPRFVARDICDILELGDTSKAVSRLPEIMKGTNSIPTPGGNQDMLTVTEAGMYKLVFTSRKPEAESFTDWLATEVIPSIRKHGAYMTAETIERTLTDPDYLIRLATTLKEEREARIKAERQIEADKPKVVFADAVSAAHTSILIGDLAKLIKQNGVEIGQKRLFAWLRENGYLIRRMGADYNMPMQRYMEMGLFDIKETAITHSDGHISVSKTVKVTGKGQQYFINKFLTA
jgi:anti-repressor protein